MPRPRLLTVELLEDRCTPSALANSWPLPQAPVDGFASSALTNPAAFADGNPNVVRPTDYLIHWLSESQSAAGNPSGTALNRDDLITNAIAAQNDHLYWG